MNMLVMYGFELSGHNHNLVYETDAEQFTDIEENRICYCHTENGDCWLGYVIADFNFESESMSYDIGILILAQAQSKIKEIHQQYFSELELQNTTAMLHVINQEL